MNIVDIPIHWKNPTDFLCGFPLHFHKNIFHTKFEKILQWNFSLTKENEISNTRKRGKCFSLKQKEKSLYESGEFSSSLKKKQKLIVIIKFVVFIWNWGFAENASIFLNKISWLMVFVLKINIGWKFHWWFVCLKSIRRLHFHCQLFFQRWNE